MRRKGPRFKHKCFGHGCKDLAPKFMLDRVPTSTKEWIFEQPDRIAPWSGPVESRSYLAPNRELHKKHHLDPLVHPIPQRKPLVCKRRIKRKRYVNGIRSGKGLSE